MSQPVQGPDGNLYQFPEGTTKEQAVSYFKKKGIGVAQAEAQPQAPQQPQGAIERFARGFNKAVTGSEDPSQLLQSLGDEFKQITSEGMKAPDATVVLQGIHKGMSDLWDRAAQEWKNGNWTTAQGLINKGNAAVHAVLSGVPVIGPQMSQAADQFSAGNAAGGAGQLAGTALNVAAVAGGGEGPSVNAQQTAQRMYRSALKPSTVANPAKVEAAVATGLKEGIPVSGAGLEKLQTLLDDVNGKIADTIQSHAREPIDPQAVAARADQVKPAFRNQVNAQPDIQAIEDTKQQFLAENPTLNAADAQAMKTGTYKQLGKRSYGELKSAQVEAQKALARGLKEELAAQFPELSKLNAKDSEFYNLQPLLERAVARITNRDMVGIGTPIAGGAAKAITGSTVGATAAAVLKSVLDNPAVKSRLAIALNKAGVSLPMVNARIAALSSALGQHDADANTQPDANQP